jgi:hypothetical protein
MTTEDEKTQTAGLALSGGGHRATLFALGVLLYLSDCGRSGNVTSISSVSGGSITNAFLCLLDKPFNRMSAAEFDECAACLARQIAGRPIVFWASLVPYAVALVLFAGDMWLGWRFSEAGAAYPVAAAVIPLLVSTFTGPRSLGTLWSWWGTWAYVGAVFAVVVLALWLELPLWVRVGAIVAAAAGVMLRPVVASVAIGRSIERASGWPASHGTPARLAQAGRQLTHVFCATDMHDGEHVFFCTNDLVFSPSFGIGTAGDLTLRAAVQGSANFPGAFPPRLLRASRHRFEGVQLFAEGRRIGPVFSDMPEPFKTLVVTDGGVRDNLALTWHLERKRLAHSLRRYAEQASEINVTRLKHGLPGQHLVEDPARMRSLTDRLSESEADHVISVNAAYTPAAWAVPFAWIPFLGEIYSLLKLPTVFYHRTNRTFVHEFRRSIFMGRTRAALISIDNTPLDTAGYIVKRYSYFSFPRHEPEFQLSPFEARAKAVMDWNDELIGSFRGKDGRPPLGEVSAAGRRYFREIVAACRDEGTHLNPTGKNVAAKLLFHGYTSAMTNLHILAEAYPLTVPAPRLADFICLAEGRPRR